MISFGKRPVFALLLMLGVVTAILMPYRVTPIPNFLPEVLVAVFAYLAAIVTLAVAGMPRQSYWGWSTCAPLILAAWLIACIPFTRPPYPDTLIFPILSLIAAGIATSAGIACRQEEKFAAACWVLALSWIVASLGTAVLQVVQLFNPDRLEFWLVPRRQHMQPFGNLAQRNHAACVHALALLSAAYLLWSSQKPYRWVLAVCVTLSFSGLVMSGSRIGSILGALALSAFVLLAPGVRRSDGGLDLRKIFTRLAAAGICYVAAYLLGAQAVRWTDAAQTFDGAVTRWMTYGNMPRLVLQELALKVFAEHPLIGSGWGSFTAQSLTKFDELLLPQYANNSHNLLTQLAAETGIVGLAVVVVPIAVVMVRAVRVQFSFEQAYLLLLCGIFLAYSMTEFPLWHTFFLLPFAFALGLLDTKAVAFQMSLAMRLCLVTFYAAVCVGAVFAVDRYIGIAQMSTTVFKPGRPSDELRNYVFRNLAAPGFSPQMELLVFGLLSVDKINIDEKVALGRRVVRHHIVPQLLTKQAGLLALNGQIEEAVVHVIASCRFYPDQCQFATAELETLANLDPDTFVPVLKEFNRRKALDSTGDRPN
jgi:O-antigen ligase